MQPNLNRKSSSPHLLCRSGHATMAEELRLRFQPPVKPLRPSPRPSNWLENKAQSTRYQKNISSQ
eukprot:12425414-Ditylum_brightwellii.AAC.1